MKRRFITFTDKLVSFVIGVIVVAGLNWYERVFMPVVRDFTIVSVTRVDDKIIMNGYMRKVRSCQFAGVTASDELDDGTSIDLPLRFMDNARSNTVTRSTGGQAWGPWTVEIPITPYVDQIDLSAVHKCHPFWATTTHLASIPVPAEVAQ